ncbi:putative lipoprotein [Actinoplanes octamycinicus]|uniref:Putative lipoprotein n=1 Tax=Actinoplanes octamycinicus TaxID=135948 RepID=A0A7W7GY56_9ACTN|nr:hypothetical protein [Actinoplanes octamycinicus]MBB4740287.1 putative lipoprotein [Actinoplanes octamycinicus]GIE62637.1 hypothetical protein Aoc01nite_80390 [Actinoplanes octamycinicus]
MKLGRLIGASLVACIVAVVAACGEDKALQPTETNTQASERVEKLIQEAFAQLPPGSSLKPGIDVKSLPCDDPTDGGPAGRVIVEKRYSILPPADGAWQADQVIPVLAAFWQQQGYKAYSDQRSDKRYPVYSVETPDGYLVTVQGWDREDHLDYTLGGDSPCIWENGTPDPQ